MQRWYLGLRNPKQSLELLKKFPLYKERVYLEDFSTKQWKRKSIKVVRCEFDFIVSFKGFLKQNEMTEGDFQNLFRIFSRNKDHVPVKDFTEQFLIKIRTKRRKR